MNDEFFFSSAHSVPTHLQHRITDALSASERERERVKKIAVGTSILLS